MTDTCILSKNSKESSLILVISSYLQPKRQRAPEICLLGFSIFPLLIQSLCKLFSSIYLNRYLLLLFFVIYIFLFSSIPGYRNWREYYQRVKRCIRLRCFWVFSCTNLSFPSNQTWVFDIGWKFCCFLVFHIRFSGVLLDSI